MSKGYETVNISAEPVWFNCKTGQYETGTPATDDKALEFIPQSDAARNLYLLHRKMGESILEAMRDTLTACIGGG
ncbi:MAG: hypothetical protein GY832_44590 [Chloroflexi bacterium]|nr:hypothetical protein [Chloroflexota bacterium]